jgi:hypothetical protein
MYLTVCPEMNYSNIGTEVLANMLYGKNQESIPQRYLPEIH